MTIDQSADDDGASREDFVDLQKALVAHIAEHEDDVQGVLQWAQDALPRTSKRVFRHPIPTVNARAAYWLARECWDATPLESNGFLPKPLPEPDHEEPCPCGSGDAYATCCLAMRGVEPPTPANIWPTLVSYRGDAYWLNTEKAGKLPALAVAYVIATYQANGRWSALEKLAEARLAAPRRRNEPETAEVIDGLCDAYDELERKPRKKLALLKRFAEHQTATIRACANRHLVFALLSTGDRDAAQAAFAEALEAEPDSPRTALAEVVLLTSTGQSDRAAERAKHWLEHLRGTKDIPAALFEELRSFAEDPARVQQNMLASHLPAQVRELLAWIDRHIDRPLPRQRWRALTAAADYEPLRDAHLPVTARNQHVLEEDWLALSGMRKPAGMYRAAGAEIECWKRHELWMEWLRRHPQALDSLSILDDLALLLAVVEDEIGRKNHRWYRSVVTRGADIVAKHWQPEREGTLPWAIDANRPALRLLATFIEEVIDGWEDERRENAIRLYLQLNPQDSHDFGGRLANRLLTVDRDAEALAFAEQFPTDGYAEIRYGEVLALYRLGRLDEAQTRLDQAIADLPVVPKYLLRDRLRRPRRNRHGGVSDKERAWLYRHDMRAVWQGTEGALDWLSRNAPPRRRRRASGSSGSDV